MAYTRLNPAVEVEAIAASDFFSAFGTGVSASGNVFMRRYGNVVAVEFVLSLPTIASGATTNLATVATKYRPMLMSPAANWKMSGYLYSNGVLYMTNATGASLSGSQRFGVLYLIA